MNPLVQAVDQALAFVCAHPETMTRAEVDEFCRLADRVYDLAFRAGLVLCLPKVSELRPQLESDDRNLLPPPQFESKLHLPGDWDYGSAEGKLPPSYPLCGILPDGTPLVCEDEPPAVPERVFFVCATPRWCADMDALRRLALQSETPQTTDREPQSSIEQHMQRVAQAVGDDNAARILAIAQRSDLPGERKMEEILHLDKRFAEKDSTEWGKLLNVSPAAVRGYGLWKRLQERKNADS